MDARPRIETRHRLRTRNKLDNGGALWVMDGLDKEASDCNDIMAIGRWFAEAGNVVQVLGIIHYKNPDYNKYFGPLLGTEYYKKCPDLKIGNKLYEYEGFVGAWSKKKLSIEEVWVYEKGNVRLVFKKR